MICIPLLTAYGHDCTNMTHWEKQAKTFCNNTENTVYHCLPTNVLNESKEVCVGSSLMQPGYCAVYNNYVARISFDQDNPCSNKNFSGCPDREYISNKIFQFPSCLKINPHKRCYLADPACPDIEDSMTTVNPGDDSSDAEELPSYKMRTLLLILLHLLVTWVIRSLYTKKVKITNRDRSQ